MNTFDRYVATLAISAFVFLTNGAHAQGTLAPEDVIKPEESLRMIHTRAGFRVRLFASEPVIANPLAIDFDEQGRAYVLEARQYPVKAEDGQGADRIVVLEDTDGDFQADRATVFAEGLNLASGIAVGYGGVFVGEAPRLLFLRDTDGDGRADERRVLLEGWATEDTHETLNSFLLGPDGWLYGTHGVMHESIVRGKKFNAAVWRYHPRLDRFEVLAEGTNNPWGLDYNNSGDWFVSTSVIPHIFHIVPGGFHRHGMVRWWSNPYAYAEIWPIVDHRHFPPRYSGWELLKFPLSASSARHLRGEDVMAYGGGHAHSGLALCESDLWPADLRGCAILGNLHGRRLNVDRIRPYRSSYIATHEDDLLWSDDPFFRPVHVKFGPGGALYVLDWYDRQICHNTDPAVWDKQLGRIYVVLPDVIHTDGNPARLPERLTDALNARDPWVYRRALAEWADRGLTKEEATLLREAVNNDDSTVAVRALWGAYSGGALQVDDLFRLVHDARPFVRAVAVRLLANHARDMTQEQLRGIGHLASDAEPRVRRKLASLLVRAPSGPGRDALLHALWQNGEDVDDPTIPALLWTAYERDLLERWDARRAWLIEHASAPLVRENLFGWVGRRLCEEGDTEWVKQTLLLAGTVEDRDALRNLLAGAAESLTARGSELFGTWREVRDAVLRRLERPEEQTLADHVGMLVGDDQAELRLARLVTDSGKSKALRLRAAESLRYGRLNESAMALAQVVADEAAPPDLRETALQSLSRRADPKALRYVIRSWQKLGHELQHDLLLAVSTSKVGARELLRAVGQGVVPRDEVPEGVIRRILMQGDPALEELVRTSWGAVKTISGADVRRRLARMGVALSRLPGNRKAGEEVFRKHCAKCHRFRNLGTQVGPDLGGANLKDPFYLLYNIVDPNRVVGTPYFTAVVADRAGRIYTGLIARQTDSIVELLQEEGKVLRLAREDIESLRVVEQSLMPEDIADQLTEQQFSDLVAFLMEDLNLSQGHVYGPVYSDRPLEEVHPIELAADPLEYDREGWRVFQLGPAGRLVLTLADIQKDRRPPEAAFYVVFRVRSPRAMETTLVLDARKNAVVWLNGALVYRADKLLTPVNVPVRLEPGSNVLLIKVTNLARDPNAPAAAGECSLAARIVDPNFELELIPPRTVPQDERP